MQISVYGMASKKTWTFEVFQDELDDNLMNWLLAKSFPIASSCNGKGICKKCVIQNDWKTCELTLGLFLKIEPKGIIRVSYL